MSGTYDINWTARAVIGSGLAIGKAACLGAGGYVPATSANLAIAGRISGVCITIPDNSGTFQLQYSGEIPPSITGLSPGASPVIADPTTGVLLKKTAPVQGIDSVIGTTSADGTLLLSLGLSSLGPTSQTTFNVATYGAKADGIADDSPAVNAAIAAATIIFPFSNARTAEIYFPPGVYRFASCIRVAAPITFKGNGDPFWGRGASQIFPDAGLRAAFQIDNPATSPNGGDGTGACITNLEIHCSSTVSTLAYSSNTTPALNAYLKPTNYPHFALYQVIQSGNVGASAEPSGDEGTGWDNAHTDDPAVTWTANRPTYNGNYVRGTDPTHWDVMFQCTTPIRGVQATTGATEPAWDFTIGHTTNDNGIVWTCVAAGGVLVLGAAKVANRTMAGILAHAPCSITDCAVYNAQTYGIEVHGNASFWGSDAEGAFIERVAIHLPGGGNGGGLYVRGGAQKTLTAIHVRVYGSSVGGLGPQALGSGGWDRNEHGIVDWSTQGANTFIGCYAENCGGFAYWAGGGSSQSKFYGCSSNSDRVRLDGSAVWVGDNQFFWSGAAGAVACSLGYASAAPSLTPSGFKNPYATVGVSNYPAQYTFSLAAEPNQGFLSSTPQDSGFLARQYVSGWWTEFWASTALPYRKISTRQVDHENGGNEWSVKGFYMGAGRLAVFADDAAFKDFGFRGGFRNVGDLVMRNATNAVAGGPGWEIVITSGYQGAAWQALTFYTNYVAPNGAGSGYPGECVTDPITGNSYRVHAGGSGQSGSSTPNFALAPNLGNTFTEGSVTWENVGKPPVLAPLGIIGLGGPLSGQFKTTTSTANQVIYTTPDFLDNSSYEIIYKVNAKVLTGQSYYSCTITDYIGRNAGSFEVAGGSSVGTPVTWGATNAMAAVTMNMATSGNARQVRVTNPLATNIVWEVTASITKRTE